MEDGNLEFLGRLDHQVKVRGFRIELGEIETALSECEGVEQAVVVAREDRPGEKFLAAYVVSKSQEQSLSAQELRERLKQRLPEYMVPAAIIILERMPLTSNGKIDRKALPHPQRSSGGEQYVAPRGYMEEMLCGIWSQALGVERVGVEEAHRLAAVLGGVDRNDRRGGEREADHERLVRLLHRDVDHQRRRSPGRAAGAPTAKPVSH